MATKTTTSHTEIPLTSTEVNIDSKSDTDTAGDAEKSVCGHCAKNVTKRGKNSHGLTCDCCGFWVHIECEGMTMAHYKMWKELGNRAKFYCSVRICREMADKFFSFLEPLERNVKDNTKRIEVLETRLDQGLGLGPNVSDLDNKISQEVDKVIDQNFKANISDEIDSKVNNAVALVNDKIYRSRNIVIVGLSESTADSIDQRISHDVERVNKLCSDVLLLPDFKVMDCIRLGEKSQNTEGTEGRIALPRLTKVRFSNEDTVTKLIKNVRKLSLSTDEEIKKLKIFRDKRKEERMQEKELVTEAQSRNESETDATMVWKVDYRKKGVIRVKKEGDNLPFRL